MLLLALPAIGMIAAACSSDEDDDDDDGAVAGAASDTLKSVLDRGKVIVGVKDSQPGFGNLEQGGTFAGQDVEYAHALAAALFGDKSKVEFVVASASTRIELSSAAEIDLHPHYQPAGGT